MEQPRILLIGKNGQVGWELRRTLAAVGSVLSVDYPEVDLTDLAAVRRWVLETKPAVLINAAAYTAVDKAESEPKIAQQINALAPGALAEAAKEVGALMIHYSTDYVFDGAKAHTATWRGTLRDTVYYSILKDEWPSVKARLESLLAARPLA